MRFVCAVFAGAALLGACRGGPPGSADDFIGTWYDAAGSPLPDGLHGTGVLVLHAFTGSKRCGGQSVVLLNLAWPIGTRATSGEGEVRQYVRDPTGAVGADLEARFPRRAQPARRRSVHGFSPRFLAALAERVGSARRLPDRPSESGAMAAQSEHPHRMRVTGGAR